MVEIKYINEDDKPENLDNGLRFINKLIKFINSKLPTDQYVKIGNHVCYLYIKKKKRLFDETLVTLNVTKTEIQFQVYSSYAIKKWEPLANQIEKELEFPTVIQVESNTPYYKKAEKQLRKQYQ